MSNVFCPSCGASLPPVAAFCPTCGRAVTNAGLSHASASPADGAPLPPRTLTAPTHPKVGRYPALSTPSHPRTSTPHQDPYLGATIAGRFEVLELIGQGGMGKVYKARHVGLDKIVCIKTLKPALLEDATVVGRFEREAKAASRLDHPNSIQVLDFGQDELGALFLVMEFVQGKDLRKTLRDEFPLPEERICHILEQVLSAVAKAHAQGVIHRDLKPENILVSQKEDQPDFVKVLDFGIAKIQDSNQPGLTRADLICGTPEYLSPEQACGKPFDHRADLYAIGVILYQLTTGTLPFQGDSPMEILTKHVQSPVEPPSKRRPEAHLSPGLEALILRALDKDPAKRPQTAEEFRKELVRINAPVVLTPNEATTDPHLAPVAPAPAPPPPAASEKATPNERQASAPKREAEDEFDPEAALPKSRAPLAAALVLVLALLGAGGWWFTRSHAEHVPPAPVPPPTQPGELTQREAYDIIESHFEEVKGCFERARRRIEDSEGKVVLSIAIGQEGTVNEASIPESTLALPKLETCILERAKKWTFPRPRPGTSLMLSYPYIFRRR